MNLNNIKTSLARSVGKTELMIKKNSPEILLGAGIAAFVGTVVVACMATRRADEVLEHHKKRMKDFKDAKEIADAAPDEELEYTDELYKQDVLVETVKTAGNIIKTYAPAIALGTLSLTCILSSQRIMKKRYMGVVAAYNGLSAVFEKYRSRVREEYGEDLDKHFRYGTTYSLLPEVDENGKKTGKKVKTENTYTEAIMPNNDFSRVFDKTNKNWDSNPSFAMMFLRGQQNYLNDVLHTRGHVFLNEVYDCLGFEHTPEGAVVGWLNGNGDDCIDFGLYDLSKNDVRRFINGTEDAVLLEFNHDGIIYDKI